MKPYRSIGIMSGTSADGIDAVLLQVNDVYTPHTVELLARASMPFTPELSHEIVHAQELTLKRLTELHFVLPRLYAETVKMLPEWRTAQCCGVHGQTITHQVFVTPPTPKSTLQIGVSSALATLLQMPVVGDFRSADVALGGQGAPIVPVAHWFFLGHEREPTLVVNLGGICNITLVTPSIHAVQGYDIGPGMMLSDAYARLATDGALSYDQDGTLSGKGRVLPQLMDELCQHPFVQRRAPKSAGREEFGRAYYEPLFARYHGKHASADIMRTLIEATARILKNTMTRDFGATPPFTRLVLTGGGALNPQMRAAMAQHFHPVPVDVEPQGVLAPQNHEPAAMAVIAARTMHGLPSALPQVTGAAYGGVLGHIFRPSPPSARLHAIAPTAPPLTERLAALMAGAWHTTAQRMLSDGVATAVSMAAQAGADVAITGASGVAQRYTSDGHGSLRELSSTAQTPITPQSVFDVASLTKVVATTACIMALVADGRLAVHARAALFVPELGNTNKDHITVEQLLSHQSGLSAWAPMYLLAQSPAECVAWIANSPLRTTAGRLYSDLGYMLLGTIVERITGLLLAQYFDQRIAQPLQLNATRFGPIPEGAVATAHNNAFERSMMHDSAKNAAFTNLLNPAAEAQHPWRERTMVGEVNDGNAHYAFGGAAGHAGLFGSAQQINHIAAAMIHQGHDGAQQTPLFAPSVVKDFLQPDKNGHHLGWANPLTWQSLAPYHKSIADHGCVLSEGFTGSFIFAVPSHNITLTVLANRQQQPSQGLTPLPKLYPYWAEMVGALLKQL